MTKLRSEAGQTREAASGLLKTRGCHQTSDVCDKKIVIEEYGRTAEVPSEARVSGEETYIMCGQFGVVHGLPIKSSFTK